MEYPVRRGAEYPLPGEAADQARDACIGLGGTVVDDAAQIVPAHCLHYGVAIQPRGKTGAYANHDWSIRYAGAQIFFRQNRVHYPVRF